MRNFDFAPLYRHSVGFDRLANALDNMLQFDQGANNSYPPFNIEKTDEHKYRITLAVAGFSQDDINIETKDGKLVISAAKPEVEDTERTFLHQGIAERAFDRRFQLADHVRVSEASLENGLLHIDLEREVPEALKPRKIQIASSAKKIANGN